MQCYLLKAFVFRGGGGYGKKWHQEGSRTKKMNSVCDFVSCGEFLLEKGIIQENKLAGWGYSAGGLLVASAINTRPDLFRAAVLKVYDMQLNVYIWKNKYCVCCLDIP